MTGRIMKHGLLVVDDEDNIKFTLRHFLLQEWYEVETSDNFNETVSMISDSCFDLIITDIILGGYSGFDVLREIK